MADKFKSPWPQFGREVDSLYEKEYLFHQAFEPDNFMDILTPPETYINRNGDEVNVVEKLFGVKSYNIFIAQMPYGWVPKDGGGGGEGGEGGGGGSGDYTFEWGDPDSDYSSMIQTSVDLWTTMINRFASYTCAVYIDLYTAKEIQRRHPDSDMPQMMNRTAVRFEQFCNETPGFVFMGKIETLPQPNFFEEEIKNFFGNPKYRVQT